MGDSCKKMHLDNEEKSKVLAELSKEYKERKWFKGHEETDGGKEKWEATKEKDEWEGTAGKEDQEGEWEDLSYWEGSYHEEWADNGEWEVDGSDWGKGRSEHKTEEGKSPRYSSKDVPIKEPIKVVYVPQPPPAPAKHQDPQRNECGK